MRIGKLPLSAVLVLILSATAFAVPDSQKLGPYTVSFDIDTDYQAQVAQPVESEKANVTQMRLFVDNSTFAVIGITEYAELTDATMQVYKSIVPMNMIVLEGLNATNVEDRIIDGKEGLLVTSVPFEIENAIPSVVYRAMYWLDSKSCECGPLSAGKTNVMITSTFSKDLTESLISSLHIVKGETIQAPAPSGQAAPPA